MFRILWALPSISSSTIFNLNFHINRVKYWYFCIFIIEFTLLTLYCFNCPWPKRAFKSNDIDCGLTRRWIGLTSVFYPSHVTHEWMPSETSDGNLLVKAAKQRPYDHYRSCDRWCWWLWWCFKFILCFWPFIEKLNFYWEAEICWFLLNDKHLFKLLILFSFFFIAWVNENSDTRNKNC